MDILSVLFHQRSRRIGLIIPDVVITEKHSDALEITEHPVEVPTNTGDSSSGAGFTSDHAYRRPSEVVMELGFSGGGSLLDASFLDTTSIGLSLGLSPKEAYQNLLDLQRSRQPFDVVTGKRQYQNMLIRNLDVTTDKTSENVLMATVTLRELILTRTQSISVADKGDMKDGVSTSPVVNSGVKTPKPANTSILNSLFGG
ncbi:MAG: hypothetical protein LKK36_06265 [Ewingella americana]|jgi:hypothetical protein|uniref:phage baseplate protein n=1 Tax=Ewingella americana TaxID=41202 RepID=UPI00242AB044|nr:hypothetical protein [Ewingella americana]MCI1676638.1 hypothetical protein [Ewingella americana]MCI1853772.1 hypothetical protein [Ewingella americana]MCI1859987.1 hypothetical protein [Ewingella americana]MCI2142315.1 hypothetical protein [Ewingella americana]MCI2163278.1 hypothetical protein [Ewingella americana]